MGDFFKDFRNKKPVIIAASLFTISLIVIIILDFLSTSKTFKSNYTAFGSFVSSEIHFYDNNKNKEKQQTFESNLKKDLTNLEYNVLSWRADSSAISAINKGAGFFVESSSTIISYLKDIIEFSNNCEGALDVTVGELSKLWNVTAENPTIPSSEEISNLLSGTGYSSISFSDNFVKIPENQSLDLGAVGKGIACDTVKHHLEKVNGVKYATISLGGNLVLFGEKKDGWNVSIRDPRGQQGDCLGILNLNECFVATSGDYEKYFEKDGIRYHHILNPKTGYPADSGLISVTIVCNSGFLSDALSTACFVLGYEKSLPLLEKYGAQAVFVDKDMRVRITSGLSGKFTLKNDNYTLVD